MGNSGPSAFPTGAASERGVTTVLRYSLMLVIVAILISGLFVGVGELVESQQERAVATQLETIGNRLATDLATASRLVETGSGPAADSTDPTVRLRARIPDTVAGSEYRVRVEESEPTYTLVLRSFNPVVETSVVLRSAVDIETGATVTGGHVRIDYDGSKLVISNV